MTGAQELQHRQRRQVRGRCHKRRNHWDLWLVEADYTVILGEDIDEEEFGALVLC